MSKGKKFLKNIISSSPNGEQICFPLAVVKGDHPGPTLSLAAGIHGGEYCGAEAAVKLYSLIEPADLCGDIRIVPICNVPGFMSKRMFIVPQDGKTLSCSFPGNATGTYTERLASSLFSEIISPADIVIEFRGGELIETMANYVSIQRTNTRSYDSKAFELAAAFGAKNIIYRLPRKGTTSESVYTAATFAGKLGLLAEAGGQGLSSEADIDFLVSGAMNIAGYMRMIDRAVTLTKDPIHIDKFIDVVSPADGMFRAKVDVNSKVSKGDQVGIIRDFGGEEIAEVKAPEDGIVLGVVTAPGARKGETVVGLGREIR